MEFEDFGARFSVAVEDFSGSWPLLQEVSSADTPSSHGWSAATHVIASSSMPRRYCHANVAVALLPTSTSALADRMELSRKRAPLHSE